MIITRTNKSGYYIIGAGPWPLGPGFSYVGVGAAGSGYDGARRVSGKYYGANG